jgi:hypothetical protein
MKLVNISSKMASGNIFKVGANEPKTGIDTIALVL